MNNFHTMFMIKKNTFKDEDSFIKFYQKNQMVLLMIEFCEVMNPESFMSKILQVDTAVDFFHYVSASTPDDNQYMKDLNQAKQVIDEFMTPDPEAPLNTTYSNDQAKQIFETELRSRIKWQSYKHGGETFQDQFESYFKQCDPNGKGTVDQMNFEHVMYAIIGVHYPVTIAVLKQYFNSCKEGSSNTISYKKIGEEVVKKEDQKIQKQIDDF